MVRLYSELAKIKGIAPKFVKNLAKLDIYTVKDLLWHFPFRYEDYSEIVKIKDLKPNQTVTVVGEVKKISLRRTFRKRMTLVEAIIADETGGVKALWFNQPYVVHSLKTGRRFNFAGKLIERRGEVYLSNPAYEILTSLADTKHTAGLIGIYSETKHLTSRGIRFLIKLILKNLEPLEDWIPEDIRRKYNLPYLRSALENIHFPKTQKNVAEARRRFAFEDLFLLQLNNLKTRHSLSRANAFPISLSAEEKQNFLNSLPFELTNAQKRSLEEVLEDIKKKTPMNRLLQGDVGSGKTVVAAIAAHAAALNGLQSVFMAPTEVLARQHYFTLASLLPSHPLALLTGNEARVFYGDGLEHEKPKRARLKKEIQEGKIKIIVGTHAVIQKDVSFNNLALAIVDEQHRFGVQQRAKLSGVKSGSVLPHFLSMSATPIPRTLALTLFGDLDISIIDELPTGRKEIITKIVSPQKRNAAYQFIREQVKKCRQVFVICPRIEKFEEDDNGRDPGEDKRKMLWSEVKNVTEEYEKLSKKIFPDLRVGMLHGKLKSKEKEEVMKKFADGALDILVSTSVVEVGIDVPNATVMMVEGADRFGLSQLYQFRGRVGRGEHQSYCLLFTDSDSLAAKQRLNALIKAKNGFELAEYDLKLRGPGQFLGDKQTGMPDLAMKSLNNIALVKDARLAAGEIIRKDPELYTWPALKSKFEEFQKEVHLE